VLKTLREKKFDIQFESHAAAILGMDFPQALADLESVLSSVTIPVCEIIDSGDSLSKGAKGGACGKASCETAPRLLSNLQEYKMNQAASKTVIDKVINIVSPVTKVPLRFRNYYLCPNDGTRWHDDWNHLSNDRCPVCNTEIEPYFNEDLTN